MKTKMIKIEEVKVGDVVADYGYRFIVQENHFDPYGNCGTPRHILRCIAVPADVFEPNKNLTPMFRERMSIGRNVGLPVTVITE